MGLLNFRKKNKKSDIVKDNLSNQSCENGIDSEVCLSAVKSFITGTSDIPSKNLLDEIFNELPLPTTSLNSFSGKTT